MFDSTVALFFLLLLLCATVLLPVGRERGIPYPLLLVAVGYLGSEWATRVLGIDTGVRWDSFYGLVFYGLVPALIFREALDLDPFQLRRNLLPVLLLAFPLMVVGAVLTAAMLYYGIGHPTGFPWVAALLAGVLLSATDPSAVLSLLRQCGVPDRILVLLEGESLFNDAITIVLFHFLLQFAVAHHSVELVPWTLVWQLGMVFFGGMVMGVVCYALFMPLLHLVRDANGQMLLSLVWVYLTFLVVERHLHCSGIMAILVFGLLFGHSLHRSREFATAGVAGPHGAFIIAVWGLVAHLCELLIFLLAGLTVTLGMFAEQWLAMLLAIGAVVLARCLIIFPSLTALGWLPGQHGFPFWQQGLLVWSGVRGTVTLALALSLPTALEGWYTIQSMAYGVVLFTLFVQGGSLSLLRLRR